LQTQTDVANTLAQGGAPPNGRSWGQGNGTLVEHGAAAAAMDVDSSSIVLHEDKKYYPDAADVFAGAETVVLDEDAQPIEEPLIAPVRTKTFSKLETEAPETNYSAEFLAALMESPPLIRSVAIVGHLHHGKTLLTDALIGQSRATPPDPQRSVS
jgi:116 kDa U5 small nuclear ribonucleoprotein component